MTVKRDHHDLINIIDHGRAEALEFDQYGKAKSNLPENFDGWSLIEDDYGHLHIIPDQKKHLHFPSTACWCEPHIDFRNTDNGREVWKHHQVN